MSELFIRPELLTTVVPTNPDVIDSVEFPPVTLAVILLKVLLYFVTPYLGIRSDQKLFADYESVIVKMEVWRLLYAHLFQLNLASLGIDVFALFSTGRYIETKVRPLAYLVIIQVTGIVTNLLYILMTSHLCSAIIDQHALGIRSVNYAFRLWVNYLMDPTISDITTLYGLYSPDTPFMWHPVPVLAEVVLIKILEKERLCMTSAVVGAITGFLLLFIMKSIPRHIWMFDDDEDWWWWVSRRSRISSISEGPEIPKITKKAFMDDPPSSPPSPSSISLRSRHKTKTLYPTHSLRSPRKNVWLTRMDINKNRNNANRHENRKRKGQRENIPKQLNQSKCLKIEFVRSELDVVL